MPKVFYLLLLLPVAVFMLWRLIPYCCLLQGRMSQDRGDFGTAESWFMKALAFERRFQQGARRGLGIAHILSELGILYHQQRRIPEAVRAFSDAIEIFSEHRRVNIAAPVYACLGKACYDSGDLQRAEDAVNHALEIYSRRIGSEEAVKSLAALMDRISERRTS